ncbi:3-deoxy-D-manno-octulosonic acid transferase [Thetidibacter halocola]|uniref:3-deoxy-D-manno-octulosonic acid transferase n=1 Tax=Thetidibacter halocola TaxID=2827239 RepID=A0A8J7WHK7_9RHOB|nr:glycosyltransferase N-terminal domain-containing protein [Thetidibacter halocola]MBS0125456.1 3-deoxy-D-manno-octulosonic acid transferase [Thetidibacter halocola]
MARRALSLQAYLAYGRGPVVSDMAALPDRPKGPGVLLMAEDRENGRALAGLGARLLQQMPELTLFCAGAVPLCGGAVAVSLPPDRSADCAAFVASLAPVAAISAGQALRPALLDALAEARVRLLAINAADAAFITPAPRWIPDPAPAALALFDVIHAIDTGAARRLRRLGVEPASIRPAGRLVDAGMPLDCSDRLHSEMSRTLASRPVWLAAYLRADEADSVLRAHRQAVRLAHRLLLVAVPATREDAPALRNACTDLSLRAVCWEEGGLPDETTQVLLTEGTEDLGLWYRLAPLTFLGSSLVSGHGGRDPYEAAALGTAILYGPNVGHWLDAYSRLVTAGAARIVRDADSLAAAVTHLIAPDQTAAMAHAGWDVVSQGAALVDAVIADVAAALEARKA